MKKKFLFPLMLLLLCLFSGTAYAEPSADSGEQRTGEFILTEENRYDPAYYQEPEERYPAAGATVGRSAEVSLEDYVVGALEQFQLSIDVSAYQIQRSDASDVFFQILNSHPSLFYVEDKIGWTYTVADNTVVCYTVTYSGEKEDIQFQQEMFRQEVGKALEWVNADMAPVEKALAVHDYLVLECEYDYENYLSNSVPHSSHTAYGALVGKTAVCDGYARAYACILGELGIESTVVGSSIMNHAWNLVSIDGSWYHADATWDDPVWDSIGRVSHKYFLLSDAAISSGGEEEKHKGWDSNGITADSTTYDNAFWSGVNSAIINDGGNWYYSKFDEAGPSVNLMKKAGSLDAQEEVVHTAEKWGSGGSHYTSSFMYLDWEPRKGEIYFNTTASINKLDGAGTPVEVYRPELPQNTLIYGFTVKGAKLCYALQAMPDIGEKQPVEEYILEELLLKPMEGVSADDVDAVYDGSAKEITFKGLKAGDMVSFLLAGGEYGAKQPEMINAGTYQVIYKVRREGYEDLLGSAQITIQKAAPKYQLPKGLKGNSGSMLSSVTLPKGFAWENASVKLKETGEQAFYVTYTPEDAQNYETVSNIAVAVTVSCPKHNYIGKVTIAPATTKKGKKTYTCSLCGHTYDEEIPMLGSGGTDSSGKDPENPGGDTGNSGTTGGTGSSGNPTAPKKVSGLKLSKAAASSLKFSWKPANGAKYRIMLYQGSKKVSTKYTGGSSYTFKKLKSATLYTVKVASYVEKNGKKTYASSSAALKTATAPAKAKLSSVKKRGSGKVKLTWKKVLRADGYEISMRTGKGSYKAVKVIAKGKTTSYTKAGLKKGKSYTFRIRAYKKAGSKKIYGSYSSGKTLKMK